MERSATDDLIDLADSPSLVMPDELGRKLIERDGYVVVARPGWGTVEQIRLGDLDAAVRDVAAIGREHGLAHLNWWVGKHSTPPDLAERLVAAGFETDPEMPLSRTLTLTEPPAGEATADIRRVGSAEEYALTREIAAAIWPPMGAQPDPREEWEQLSGSDASQLYLAYLDGDPAGFGRAVFTPAATLLLGGAVLPEARGRGVYVSLVHARWDDSVARSVPRLLVGAGPMSAPILERLGFEQIGTASLFRQRL